MATSRDPIFGLINYILDIKPYHSKIAEILIDWVATDLVNVTITENFELAGTFVYDSQPLFSCDVGYGVLPWGEQDQSLTYMPDSTISGFITPPPGPFETDSHPIVYINPFNNRFFIEGDFVAQFPVDEIFQIRQAPRNNGLWKVVAVQHLTGDPFPVDITEIEATFEAALHETLPITDVDPVILTFVIQGDLATNYSVGNSFVVEDSTNPYNGQMWQILTQTNPTFTVTDVDATLKTLTVVGDQTQYFTAGDFIFTSLTGQTPLSWIVVSAVFGVDTVITINDPTNQLVDPGLDPDNGVVQTNYFIVTTQHITNATVDGNVSPAINPFLLFPITGINVPTNLFVINGDETLTFPPASFLDITGSTANDGRWLITSVVFDGINNTTRIFTTHSEMPPLTGPVDGGVPVAAFSNWDVPEFCKTASATTTSAFIGEYLLFEYGTEITFFDYVFTRNPTFGQDIPWGGGGGTEETPVVGGNQIGQQFFVSGNIVLQLILGGAITITGSTGNDGTYHIVSAFYNIGTLQTEITVAEVIPSGIFDGNLTYEPSSLDSPELIGWDVYGYDAQTLMTETVTIVASHNLDAGGFIDSWDYNFWDIGGWDETLPQIVFHHGPPA